jgi:hypothetical protein
VTARLKMQSRNVIRRRRRSARKQRRYAAAPNSRTMMPACVITCLVVMTPEIIGGLWQRRYGPEEVIGSANACSASRVSANEPCAAEPDTEPAIRLPATVPSKTPSPGNSK